MVMEHYYNTIEGWFYNTDLYSKVVKDYDNAHFVEIGVWKGRSTSFMAVEIINSGKNIKFDVVDTFGGSKEHGTVSSTKLYESFIKNLIPAGKAINDVHVTTSINASRLYPDNSLDFVFIDASHEYADVIDDIEHWYPKVKKGGIIGGDDYSKEVWPDVVRAVHKCLDNEFKLFGPHWYHLK